MQKYQEIARAVEYFNRSNKEDNPQWIKRAIEQLDRIDRDLPSGSGIDNGCRIDRDKSTEKRIVLEFGFHHMDEDGFYCGWTDHTAVITPSLCWDFDLRITGRDRNQIKDSLHEVFHTYLSEEC